MITKIYNILKKYMHQEVNEELKNMINSATAPKVVEPEKKTNIIGIEDFSKIELRVGKILEAHTIDGADKLYRFLVDVGETTGPRTILSGIREYFPDQSIFPGRYVCVVANLAPRKMRGFESNGMLLFAGGDSGKLFHVEPVGEPVPGTLIR
jgi:methionyl-tRNA synthetase